jgi:Family of unknown function (DUF6452)
MVLICTLFRCSQNEPCSQSIQTAVNIKFYIAKNSKQANTLKYNLTVGGIDRPDSLPFGLLYYNTKNINPIKLPLSPNGDQCSFVLFFDSIPITIVHKDTIVLYHSFTDTIQFRYSRKLKLLTTECGFIMECHLDSTLLTKNGFDSIYVSQPDINSGNEENIKIFF